MTIHEALTSLFWLVLLGYGAYLGWFVYRSVHRSRSDALTEARARHPSASKPSVHEIFEVDHRTPSRSFVVDTSSGDAQPAARTGDSAR